MWGEFTPCLQQVSPPGLVELQVIGGATGGFLDVGTRLVQGKGQTAQLLYDTTRCGMQSRGDAGKGSTGGNVLSTTQQEEGPSSGPNVSISTLWASVPRE